MNKFDIEKTTIRMHRLQLKTEAYCTAISSLILISSAHALLYSLALVRSRTTQEQDHVLAANRALATDTSNPRAGAALQQQRRHEHGDGGGEGALGSA